MHLQGRINMQNVPLTIVKFTMYYELCRYFSITTVSDLKCIFQTERECLKNFLLQLLLSFKKNFKYLDLSGEKIVQINRHSGENPVLTCTS